MESFTRRKSGTFKWSETNTLPPTNTTTFTSTATATIPNCKLKPNRKNISHHSHHHRTPGDHSRISRWNFGESRKSILFLLLSVFLTGVLSEENNLSIVPSSKNRVYQRALGKSAIFTCTANVSDPEKLTEFRWWWPDGKIIEATDNRVEIMRDHTDNSLTLLFTSIQEKDLGMYKCTAVYDNKEQLSTGFTLRAYVPITFEDAPTNQYAVKGQDYKVKCQVKADPEPQVDWKKDHRVINNSGSFDQIQSSKSESVPTSPTTADFEIPMMIILFAVASAVIILLLIDLSCYRINQAGLIWTIFGGMCNKKRSRESLVKDATPNEKKPLKDDTPDIIVVTDQQSPSPTKPSNDQSAKNGNHHDNEPTNNINNIIHYTHPDHQQHNPNNSQV